jgi:hypothetical protein
MNVQGNASRLALPVMALALCACGRLAFDPRQHADAAAAPLPPVINVEVPAFSTPGTSFVDVPGGSLLLPPSEVVTSWVVVISGWVSSTSQSSEGVQLRHLVDGEEQALSAASETLPRFAPAPHLIHVAAGPAPIAVTCQLRAVAGTARVERLQLIAIPFEPANDLAYAEAIAPQHVEDAVRTYLRLSFPSRPADYLVLVAFNANEAPGVGTITTRVLHDGSSWPEGFSLGNARNVMLSYMLARLITSDGAEQTIELRASGDEVAGSTLAFARIVAFDTTALAGFARAQERTPGSSSGADAVVASLESPLEPPYVALQTLAIASDTVDAATAVRVTTPAGQHEYEYQHRTTSSRVSPTAIRLISDVGGEVSTSIRGIAGTSLASDANIYMIKP